ncbi:hypothetical protein Patl1_29025 [Pistacia atlantica]|uniref:Uncharacterized protein n=1 Tax=Pistacia atlantica TaxID=434234 RepID=A0ACC1BFA9_9ROSI|nr:hypothetical protein Patl1_29025 [Pistacia atlantica]
MSPCHITSLATSSCHISTSKTQILIDSNSFPSFVSCPNVPKECVNNGLSKDEGGKKKNFIKVKLVKNPNGTILCDDNTLCEEGEIVWVARVSIIEEVGHDLKKFSPLYDGIGIKDKIANGDYWPLIGNGSKENVGKGNLVCFKEKFSKKSLWRGFPN